MINFPDAPTINQLFTTAGKTWLWNGTKWIAYTSGGGSVEALALAGLQINGDMQISQESGTASRTTVGYIMDGWRLGLGGTAVAPARQYPSGPAGIPSFLGITVTTAQPSMGAGDFIQAMQPIEGFRAARLSWGNASAQSLTIAFWTAHHRTGTHSVSVRNAANNRSYVATYTQNVTDAWEYKTVTIPGDTAGTWATDNTVGIYLAFNMAAGATLTAPAANTWYGANYVAAPGQVNGVAATTDVFRLAGVLILPGSVAPSQVNHPFCFRQYDQELLSCRRYWQNVMASVRGPASAANQLFMSTVNFTPMRANPAAALLTAGSSSNMGTPSFTVNGVSSGFFQIASAAAGDCYSFSNLYSLDSRL